MIFCSILFCLILLLTYCACGVWGRTNLVQVKFDAMGDQSELVQRKIVEISDALVRLQGRVEAEAVERQSALGEQHRFLDDLRAKLEVRPPFDPDCAMLFPRNPSPRLAQGGRVVGTGQTSLVS